MGLLDCVSDKTAKYPVSPPGESPLSRSDISGRRSIGKKSLFSSNTNIKGKDVDFWRHRVLRFLYKSEGREDVRELRMPLKQLGYTAIGDFIRDIPPEIYEPYKKQINPDTGLRKDYKVIWERDGIAEPGMFKWEGPIEGRRCMGLQLDRKRAVPYNCYDGKGLFYCKPGHRALVPVEEVFPYKDFLRQFIGLPPRKDSMPLNLGLLPGRSSVRLTVAKKYTPGDRVHLPNEDKWATILWTGRIDGEWVVDLVYDPEKPATGRMASPDEPCMSRSLSFADFIDQLGSPPRHLPTPPPKSPETDDEVFELHDDSVEIPQVINKNDGLRANNKSSSESEISGSDESLTEQEDADSESEPSLKDPGVESASESESDTEAESKLRRTNSEPVKDAKKSPDSKRQELKGLEVFEPKPLQSRATHKPLFNLNLASFGSNKKKKQKEIKQAKASPIEIQNVERVSSPGREFETAPPKKDFFFFSKNKGRSSPKQSKPKVVMTKEPKIISPEIEKITDLDLKQPSSKDELSSPKSPVKDAKGSLSFLRRDRSRSPVHRKPDRKSRTSSGEIREERPIDVPQSMRSPIQKQPPIAVAVPDQPRRKRSSDIEDFSPSPPTTVEILPSPKDIAEPIPVEIEAEQSASGSEESTESEEEEDEKVIERSVEKVPEIPKNVQVEVQVYVNQQTVPKDDSDHESYSSVSSPPYSPAIKDVGFKINKPVAKPETKKSKSSPLKSWRDYFSSTKEKSLPPKDYDRLEDAEPKPPVRKESLDRPDPSDDENSISTVEDPVSLEHNVLDEEPIIKRKTSLKRSQGGLFSTKKPKKASIDIPAEQSQSPKISSPLTPEPLGDQDGLTLDLLEVKDDQATWNSPQPASEETNIPKRKGSKGKSFFGFSKKSKPSGSQVISETSAPQENTDNVENQSLQSVSSQEDIKSTEPKDIVNAKVAKPKKSSLKDSFTRTFSFTKNKRKGSMDIYEKLEDSSERKNELIRPASLYIDNNEAIGATRITRPKSKSTSVLVDIQPWVERRGLSTDYLDVYNSPTDDTPPGDHQDGKFVVTSKPTPALFPKKPEPVVPDHRKFTTPRIFKWSQKSNNEAPKPPPKPKKKTSFKGSKIPKSMTPVVSTLETTMPDPETTEVFEPVTSPGSEAPPLPKSGPPQLPSSPPPITPRSPKSPQVVSKEKVIKSDHSSSLLPKLKSAMKQRKEIEFIPKGIKIGDRVIWYSGRIPIPGSVMKLYKDGTDKYTAVVKFDREPGKEPLSLIREGDAYIVTVEELITPEIFGIPSTSATASVTSPASPKSPAVFSFQKEISIENDNKETPSVDNKSPSVRFEPSEKSASPVPEINVEPATPGTPKEGGAYFDNHDDNDNDIPPPFQEEEIEIACGLRRGIPSREKACCLETLLFSMFYTNNTFDTSILYENGFEEDRLTRDAKTVLRHEIVYPLRQSGLCEWSAVKKLKDLIKAIDPDFSPLITDAEIMTTILFERALKLGKFISYSTGVTDYLHQLVFDPRDLSKCSTIQQLLETSLEHMDNAKLKTIPTPALIMEIPRANDKLSQYEAVVPNLSVMVSHLLEHGPRLCICGLVAKYECPVCLQKYGNKAIAYCESCKSMADQQIHFNLDHDPNLVEISQQIVTMDLISVICIQGGHYTAFVKCGSQRLSPWLFYDAAEVDNPKVSLEHNLGMWIDRLEKYPGKFGDAFAHPLLTHFLANSHICIYQSREKSSLV